MAEAGERNLFMAVFSVILAYFIGNISPSILISRSKGKDIRKEGSGNAGSTNMLRVYGKKAAAATLVVDILKGVAAVLIGAYLAGPTVSFLCADAVIIGHIWPVLYGLRGGKGIATTGGALLAISPPVAGITAAVALLVIAVSRRVSVGSVAGALLLPFIVWRFIPEFLPYALLIVILVLWKHKGNIRRIIKGEEPKIKF
jgi:acyl phosphate:glycerol-3-phosphate acyltransferase